MPYTDSHAHLDDERFREDVAEVIERAQSAGVARILSIGLGATAEPFERTLALAAGHPGVWAALGVHPHDAKDSTGDLLGRLETLVQQPKVLAWGEIGLDYHYDNSPREKQQEVFREQLRLARRAKLPVIIHCRDAWEDCLRILSEEWAASGLGGIFHCFGGSAEDARRGLDWGFLISFAGIVTFPKAGALRGVAAEIPVESLLIETDCPYLAPQGCRGKRNEPAYVVEVAGELAKLHGREAGEMGRVTTENFLRLFPRAG